jgi:Na+/H+-dicarboxylate symporter
VFWPDAVHPVTAVVQPIGTLWMNAEGAMLPVLVFTIAFALALAATADEVRRPLLALVRAIADAMLVLVGWILAVAPIGVFALALPLAARIGAATAGIVGAYVLVVCAVVALFGLMMYPLAVVLGGTPLRRFVRACLPAQAVALGSRSSIAALPAMMASARQALGVPAATATFILPIAVALMKVALPISITTGVLFLARLNGAEVHPALVATVVMSAVILSFSTPGVPSGSVLMLVPILDAVGIPAEGAGLLLAVDPCRTSSKR